MHKRILFCLFLLLLCSCSSKELSCEKGVLEEGKCKIVEEMDPELVCTTGYTLNEETKKCENTLTIDAKTISICPNGFEIGNDTWCYSEKVYEQVTTKACVSSRIEEGDTLSSTYEKNGECYEKICVKSAEDGKTCQSFEEKKISYTETTECPSGTSSIKGECRKKQWMIKKVSCEMGEMVGKKCVIQDEKELEPVCASNYALDTENNKCILVTYVDAQ